MEQHPQQKTQHVKSTNDAIHLRSLAWRQRRSQITVTVVMTFLIAAFLLVIYSFFVREYLITTYGDAVTISATKAGTVLRGDAILEHDTLAATRESGTFTLPEGWIEAGITDEGGLTYKGKTYAYQNEGRTIDQDVTFLNPRLIFKDCDLTILQEAAVFYKFTNTVLIEPLSLFLTRTNASLETALGYQATPFFSLLDGLLVTAPADNAVTSLSAITSGLETPLQAHEAGYVKIDYRGTSSYIFYAPVTSYGTINDVAVLFIVSVPALLSSASLTGLGVAVLLILGCIFVAAFIVLWAIEKHNASHDISTSLFATSTVQYFLLADQNGKIRYRNAAFQAEVKDADEYVNIADMKSAGRSLSYSYLKDKTSTIVQLPRKGNEGTLSLLMIQMVKAPLHYFIGTDVTDITEELAFDRHLALENPITSLPNEASLEIALRDVLAKDMDITLIFMRVLTYENMAKLLGLDLAQSALLTIADFIKKTIPAESPLFQAEQNVFCFWLPDETTPYADWKVSFKKATQQPLDFSLSQFNLLVKIGSFDTKDGQGERPSSHDMIANAKLALARSMDEPFREAVAYNLEFIQVIAKEEMLKADIKTGLAAHEFRMYLQPQVEMTTNRVTGFEALIRWDNDKYRHDSPQHWIEIAERSSLIIDIGRFVMEETFRIAKDFEPYGIEISMNVSPMQLMQTGFVTELINCFKAHDLKGGDIALEITETSVMSDHDLMIEKIRSFARASFKIHLDDFGIGYSSFNYLKDLPVDVIKIDRTFTQYLKSDDSSRMIVRTLVRLAHDMNLKTIAEGVETEEQWAQLKRYQNDIVQGFIIGKALSEEDAFALMHEKNDAPVATTGEEEKK